MLGFLKLGKIGAQIVVGCFDSQLYNHTIFNSRMGKKNAGFNRIFMI